jgi:ribosomal protein S18 acetylase RimI-like enzyme
VCENVRVHSEIVRLTDSQIPAAAATLAHAFNDDPLMVYTIPDPADRTRLLPDVYARMIRFGVLTGEVYVTAGAVEGVALWLPPNVKWTRENIEASGMHETPSIIGNDAYQRYREVVGREWQARERDMTDPCWYLFLLGVEPSRQRQGLGGTLMRPILERADTKKLACYLETENERNVAFYRRHGFDVIVNGEEAGASGVRFWTFSRMPQR